MNTTQLECFLAVANYLNFSRAAEDLRITQPAVSHQINTLEDELGGQAVSPDQQNGAAHPARPPVYLLRHGHFKADRNFQGPG